MHRSERAEIWPQKMQTRIDRVACRSAHMSRASNSMARTISHSFLPGLQTLHSALQKCTVDINFESSRTFWACNTASDVSSVGNWPQNANSNELSCLQTLTCLGRQSRRLERSLRTPSSELNLKEAANKMNVQENVRKSRNTIATGFSILAIA